MFVSINFCLATPDFKDFMQNPPPMSLSVFPKVIFMFLFLKWRRLSESISMSQTSKINGVMVTIVIVENIDF